MRILLFLFTLTTAFSSSAQNNYKTFLNLLDKKDTAAMHALINDWEKQKDPGAEFYVCAFNFYFLKSKNDVIQINAGTAPKSTVKTINLYDSTGRQAGYFSFDDSYDGKFLVEALHYADEGISHFPDRLDIRFGKCHVLQEAGDYRFFVAELKKTIDYSLTNHNNWYGSEDKKIEDGENYFTQTIYDYQAELYNTEEDSLLPYIQQIGDYSLKYYPKKIEILSMTAVSDMLQQNYPQAIEYLQRAEVVNPKDCIVLNNLAQAYLRSGDKANAKKYYLLIQKYGDAEERKNADEQLRKLDR